MSRSITILGAGLVGSLLSVILKKRGYDVTIFERRNDMRKENAGAGRSINLAMSTRGWKAIELAGITGEIEPIAIPMSGRFLHQQDGSTAFQAYGKNGESIYSVSRGELNKALMNKAEQEGVKIIFGHKATKIDLESNTVELTDSDNNSIRHVADLLIGADGAFSALRSSYVYRDRVNADQNYIAHGYKELHIPASADSGWQIEKNALHIWPRNNYMLIALPNIDGSFTCTLFFPFEGPESFGSLQSKEDITAFFTKNMPDTIALMPTLLQDYDHNPTSSLITTHISSWYYKNKSALIGDAAHAIVPFYGQGMNAGFEDCSVLEELLNKYNDNWDLVLPEYQKARQPNGDAVAQLALLNFIEMRDKVADPVFLERKKIEKELGKMFPEAFISVYEMVSFSHIPYAHALSCIQAQDTLLGNIMREGSFFELVQQEAFVQKLHAWMQDYQKATQVPA